MSIANDKSAVIRFEDLVVWQKARVLSNDIYRVTRQSAFSLDRDLVRQIRRCVISVMANIAEGSERRTTPEYDYFLNIAKGSSAELRSHLYIAFDQGYLAREEFEALMDKSNEIGRMLRGLMNSEKRKPRP